MFASAIEISNYRLYGPGEPFRIDDFNVPDGAPGSGLNMIVGENGCGKTSLLEAIALPLLEYKAEAFSLDDLNDVGSRASIKVEGPRPFTVKKTMPRGEFSARGLAFEGGLRSRSNSSYLSTLCVGDRQFVPVDSGDLKPGSPDLRVSVNNPSPGRGSPNPTSSSSTGTAPTRRAPGASGGRGSTG